MSAGAVCKEDSTSWELRSTCDDCGHPALAHPGRGGQLDGCLHCRYRALYGFDSLRWPKDDREDLIEALYLMVDQYCYDEDHVYDENGDEVHDSRSLTAGAVAMRILAMNGRLRIHHQAGRKVVGELLRKPPFGV